MLVAVAGGTGMVGKQVVAALAAAGHQPVVLARGCGIDLISGEGLSAALSDVEAVIDVSNLNTRKATEAVAFFGTATRQLLAAGERAGVRHHLALSIVGIDRVNMGYYEGKRKQEELVLAGQVPATVLRSTQFHEFAGQLLAQLPGGPIAVVPSMRTQPIAAREVASALVTAIAGPPAGLLPELAGPREESLVGMIRQLLRARGSRRRVLPIRLPAAGGAAMAAGGLLPSGPGPRGEQTYADWLAEQPR
jgi:uncharacterized protein YbjT (DUF2867 family)